MTDARQPPRFIPGLELAGSFYRDEVRPILGSHDPGLRYSAALIAARLVRDVMRLAFLMEREYPPYPKWFGTAFSGLHSATRPALRDLYGDGHAGPGGGN